MSDVLPCSGCGAVIGPCSDQDFAYTLTGDPSYPFVFFCGNAGCFPWGNVPEVKFNTGGLGRDAGDPAGGGSITLDCNGVISTVAFPVGTTQAQLNQYIANFVAGCTGTGGPTSQPLSLQCCSHTLTRTVYSYTTAAQLAALVASMYQECFDNYAAECRNPLCPDGNCDCPGGDCNGPRDPVDPTHLYLSRALTCSICCDDKGRTGHSGAVTCLDGSPTQFTVPPGRFFGPSQQVADSNAFNFACQQARMRQRCFVCPPTVNGALSAQSLLRPDVTPQFGSVFYTNFVEVALSKGDTIFIEEVSAFAPYVLAFLRGYMTAGNAMPVNTITDASKSWPVDCFKNLYVAIYPSDTDLSGYHQAQILSNTATVLTLSDSTTMTIGKRYAIIVKPGDLATDKVGTCTLKAPADGTYSVAPSANNDGGVTGAYQLTFNCKPCSARAYWAFEPTTIQFFDAINQVPLVPNGTLQNLPGRIAQGVRLDSDSGYNVPPGMLCYKPGGGGMSFVFWMRVYDTPSAPTGAGGFVSEVNLGNLGGIEVLGPGTFSHASHYTAYNFTDYSNVLSIDNNWHFFHVFFDEINNKMGYQVDNGARTYLPTVLDPATFNDPASPMNFQALAFYSGLASNPAHTGQVVVDEAAFYGDKLLRTDQVNFLYNAGAGRTWPFDLPP